MPAFVLYSTLLPLSLRSHDQFHLNNNTHYSIIGSSHQQQQPFPPKKSNLSTTHSTQQFVSSIAPQARRPVPCRPRRAAQSRFRLKLLNTTRACENRKSTDFSLPYCTVCATSVCPEREDKGQGTLVRKKSTNAALAPTAKTNITRP